MASWKRSPGRPRVTARGVVATGMVALVVVALAACGVRTGEAAAGDGTAAGAGTVPAVAGTPAAPGLPRHTAADVRFMQDMMVHHAQAVAMTALVAERTDRRDIVMLAERIAVSQEDELAQMRRWLDARGAHGDHAHGDHAGMPGMLSPAEMAALEAARGAAFDRLFLESMIRHHEGALVMVEQLFATDGAGQEPELFQFASHVDGDQRIEIARMRRMLEAVR
jgi:uncharacterized protein (DUF305 family)